MSKRLTKIIAIVLVVLLGFVGVLALAVDSIASIANAEPERDAYDLNISIIEQLDAVRVDQQLVYTNRTGGPLTQVVFNLSANAYRRQLTVPIEMSAMDGAYPDGFTPGGADFFLIEVNGEPADWGVQGDAEAFLRVAVALEPGETCTFRFGFELLMPSCRGSFGVTRNAYQLEGFYPMAAPWDEHLQVFETANVQAVGQTLMADPADYTVRIDAPKNLVPAAPGSIVLESGGERNLWQIDAAGIRMFSLVLGANTARGERTSEGGVRITSLLRDGGAAGRVLDAVSSAVDFYESVLGPCPFDALTIAQVDHVLPAHAGSAMIFVDSALLSRNMRDELEYQLALGTAKQWFFEQVSHNPAREPWLSEATGAYMALRHLGARYGEARFYDELNARVLPALLLTLPGGVKVDSATMQFASNLDFDTVMRQRGSAVMYELSLILGEDGLYDVLRLYIKTNAGKLASVGQFAAALNEITGAQLDDRLMYLLQNIQEYAYPGMDWYG